MFSKVIKELNELIDILHGIKNEELTPTILKLIEIKETLDAFKRSL